MKALSLWRPWPWAFFGADKRVENRSWAPPQSVIGTWVAMHAAMKYDNDAGWRMARGDFGKAAQEVPRPDMHQAGIVGMFYVAGWCRLKDITVNLTPWCFGPICWDITRVVEFPNALPCKGMQGLWTVPPLTEREVREEFFKATGQNLP